MLQAEEAYWDQESELVRQDLLSLESRISLDVIENEAGVSPQDMPTIVRPIALKWPQLYKLPVMHIKEDTDDFEFCWP